MQTTNTHILKKLANHQAQQRTARSATKLSVIWRFTAECCINYIILYCFTTTISVPWTVDIVLIRPNKSIKEFQYDSPNHNIVNMDYFSFVFVCQLRIFIRVKMLKCMINPTGLLFLCVPVLFTKNVVICLVSWAEKINERIK